MTVTAGEPTKARVDPAGRPLEGRRRQAFQALGVLVIWMVLVGAIFGVFHADSGPPMLFMGLASWPVTHYAAKRCGLVWTGSAVAIVGALSIGVGVAMLTPEIRAMDNPLRFAMVSGASALFMGAAMLRFRLPGLVSPTVTFSIVATFLTLYGGDREALAGVEGLSARGVLAAMLHSHWAAAVFVILSLVCVWFGRRCDLEGDDFGKAAARPLHLIGIGIFGLSVGHFIELLPPVAAILAFAVLMLGITVWAVRVNRFAVMATGLFAVVKPWVEAVYALTGDVWTRQDWGWVVPGVLILCFAVWPLLHIWGMRRGFILACGGLPPSRKSFWGWRYWPYP